MKSMNGEIIDLNNFEGIIVDSREPLVKFTDIYMKFVEAVKSEKEIPEIKFCALQYGDYLICTQNNQLLIERKEFHDYCKSLGDNLEERFNHMRIENDLTMFLLEGSPVCTDRNAVYRWGNNGRYVQRAASFSEYKNFPLVQQLKGSFFVETSDYKDTIHTIISYYHYLKELPAIENKCVYKPWERWFLLIPFVGKRKIKKLIEKHDSCHDALNHMDDWATENIISGIKSKWKAKN